MKVNILFLTSDDNYILEFIKLALETSLNDTKVNVYGTKVTDEAFKIIHQDEINLIIADMDLDSIESYEFYDSLKANQTLQPIPFVFLSSDIEDQEIALLKGINNFFLKPLNDEQLIKKIHTILGIKEQIQINTKEILHKEIELLNNQIEYHLEVIKHLTKKVQEKSLLL
jgi:CheY-like chemotaxis protein